MERLFILDSTWGNFETSIHDSAQDALSQLNQILDYYIQNDVCTPEYANEIMEAAREDFSKETGFWLEDYGINCFPANYIKNKGVDSE